MWIDDGAGLRRTQVRFTDEGAVRRLAQRLASSAGCRLDDSSPFVDARLPDGIRLHAILPPISSDGTCLSLRIPRRRVFALSELVEVGMLPAVGDMLAAVVASRRAFLVSAAATGSGKTTLLFHPTLSEVGTGGTDGPGRGFRGTATGSPARRAPGVPSAQHRRQRGSDVARSRATGIANAPRPRGRSVRGAEVVDLLAALNTGHEGGCGTVHANSAADVPARLESLALPAGLNRDGLHAQVVQRVWTP